MRVERTITALFDGVSRRPQTQRREGHAQEQVNMLALSRNALSRRPPLEFLKTISDWGFDTPPTSGFVHEIRRSDDENYVAMVIDGQLRVFDVEDGGEVTVEHQTSYATLTTALSGANNDLLFTARAPGASGNAITIRYDATLTGDHALSVSVSGSAITVILQEETGAIVYPTATVLRAAVVASSAAMALVSCDLAPSNSGAGTVTAMAATHLAGGTLAEYLADGRFRAVTVGDDTIIVNTDTTTRKGTTQADDSVNEALLVVRLGDYGTNYTVTIDGTSITYSTSTSGRGTIATDVIAAGIIAALEASASLSNFAFTQYGSTIHIVCRTGDDFALAAGDGLADSALLAIKGTVQRFTDLPLKARDGFIVEVVGDGSTEFDNYFVEYQEAASAVQAGTWQEVVKPGTIVDLDASTMPHRLRYMGAFVETANGAAPVAPTHTLSDDDTVAFDSAVSYPPNSSVTFAYVTIDPISLAESDQETFTYTNSSSGYYTSAQMCEGLRALIDADADFTATVVDTHSFTVNWVGGGLPIWYARTRVSYDKTSQFASSDLAMAPNAYVGKTVRNLTDGSTTTVTSNTAVSLVTAALSGGADNHFDPGDIVTIEGTGVYFTFEECPWADREAGSLTTVPFPSFVDKTIVDVFEHQGRLGFVSGPNVILSRPGTFFYSFFRQTARQLLADDVIDIKSSLSSSPSFDSAVNWNGALLLKADKGLFEMRAEPALTPTTVSLTKLLDHQSLPALAPVVMGSSAFFTAMRGAVPMLWDMRIRGAEQTAVAEDTTLHVPAYITGTPTQLVADDSLNILFLRTDDDARAVYVYVSEYAGPNKVQSAWSRWEFGSSSIISINALRGKLVITTIDSEGSVGLHALHLDPADNPGFLDEDRHAAIHLDRLVSGDSDDVAVVYDGDTAWTLPYLIARDESEGIPCIVRKDTGEVFTPTLSGSDNYGDELVVEDQDLSEVAVFIGLRKRSRHVLSTLYVRDQNGAPKTSGVLKLQTGAIQFQDTQDLTVLVGSGGRGLREYTVHYGDPTSGIHRVPLYGENEGLVIVLQTDLDGAFSIESIAWDGEYFPRARALRAAPWWDLPAPITGIDLRLSGLSGGGGGGGSLTWIAPKQAVYSYTVRLYTAAGALVSTATVTAPSHTFTDLEEGGYYVEIEADGVSGPSPEPSVSAIYWLVPYGSVQLISANDDEQAGAVTFSPALSSHATTQTVILWVSLRDLPFHIDNGGGLVTFLRRVGANWFVWQVFVDVTGTFGDPDVVYHYLRVIGPGGGFDGVIFDMGSGLDLSDTTRRKISLVYDGGLSAASRFKAYMAEEVDGEFEADAEVPKRALNGISGTIPASGAFPAIEKIGGGFASPESDVPQLDVDEARFYGSALSLSEIQAEDITLAPATAPVHRYQFNNSLADTGSSPQDGALDGNAELGAP